VGGTRGDLLRSLAILFASFLSWGIAYQGDLPYLVVIRSDGSELLELPLHDKPCWVIRWNHSVTGVLVSDYYRLDGGEMMLTDSHTPAFDAGLGHIPGRGRLESDDAHGYWIRDIDEVVPGNGYFLRVGSSEVDHRIVQGEDSYSLSRLAAHERVRIEVIWR
jgi:hypothetical protein